MKRNSNFNRFVEGSEPIPSPIKWLPAAFSDTSLSSIGYFYSAYPSHTSAAPLALRLWTRVSNNSQLIIILNTTTLAAVVVLICLSFDTLNTHLGSIANSFPLYMPPPSPSLRPLKSDPLASSRACDTPENCARCLRRRSIRLRQGL